MEDRIKPGVIWASIFFYLKMDKNNPVYYTICLCKNMESYATFFVQLRCEASTREVGAFFMLKKIIKDN